MTLSKNADQLRRAEIAQIHIAKKELALEDDAYRALLLQVTGKESSKDLTWQERKALLDHFKKVGFKVKSKVVQKTPAVDQRDVNQTLEPQYLKILALWTDLYNCDAVRVNTESAVRIYIKRMTGCDDYRFCNGKQIETVIESLKKWLARIEEKAEKKEPSNG